MKKWWRHTESYPSFDLIPKLFLHTGDVLLKPVIAAAGKDISHWFDKKTKEVRLTIYFNGLPLKQ